jgi:hypothetical protein
MLVVLTPGVLGQSRVPGEARPGAPRRADSARVAADFGKLPVGFEENAGQADDRVKFLSRGSYHTFLTADEAVFIFNRGMTTAPAVLRQRFVNGRAAGRIAGARLLPGRANYFKGDATQWRTNIRRYAEVRYESIYPGIDLVYHGPQGALEYDLVVAPGADVGAIAVEFAGAEHMRVDDAGDLVLDAGGAQVRHRKPLIYQEVDGARQTVAGGYRLEPGGRVGFDLGEYDRRRRLVIDPVVVYSSYLGGPSVGLFGGDQGWDIAVDPAGCVYITGQSTTPEFPTTTGAFQTDERGSSDAFVAKVSADGATLLYSTLLGGPSGENFFGAGGNPGIAVDAGGHAYVTGQTSSGAEFPTTPGALYRGGGSLFITKVDPAGSSLVYSTLFPANARGDAIAVDALGQAYVTGGVEGPFPTKDPFMPTLSSIGAFVIKLNAHGSALVFSSYLGGSAGPQQNIFDVDYGTAIAVDAAGDIYVGGRAASRDFPRVTPAQAVHGGDTIDGFVTKIHSSGTFIIYSTFVGGSDRDTVTGLAVDASGSAHVAGFTGSSNFPSVNALQGDAGGYDAFVTRLSPSGSAIIFSTVLGGSGQDLAWGLALDSRGNVYVTGEAGSTDFPLVRPLPSSFGTGVAGDVFVTKLSAGGRSILYSTYLGGDNLEFGAAVAVDGAGNAYVTGSAFTARTATFPIVGGFQPTPGAASEPFGGNIDAFVAKIADNSGSCPDEITDRVQVFKLGLQRLWFTPIRFEWVLIRNISSGPVPGPLALVVDDLQNAVFIGSPHRTTCLGDGAKPVVIVPVDRDGVLAPDESVLTGVWLYRTGLGPIAYRARVLASVPLQ